MIHWGKKEGYHERAEHQNPEAAGQRQYVPGYAGIAVHGWRGFGKGGHAVFRCTGGVEGVRHHPARATSERDAAGPAAAGREEPGGGGSAVDQGETGTLDADGGGGRRLYCHDEAGTVHLL